MKLKLLPTITLCIVGTILLSTSNIYADSVTPSIFEQVVVAGSQTTGSVTFRNENVASVQITPKVSAYDPETLQLITDEKTLFITLDKESYTVQPQGTLTLSYAIKPPENLEPGTYFNLIILQQTVASSQTQKNQLGTVDSLSQLVTIHILEKQETIPLQIKTDFAQISVDVTDAGIPFLKPMSVKYTYQNTTNYVLEPQGEIQVFDGKSSYSPAYKQINATGKKLYPGDSMEETITLGDWHISDILFGRKVVGRFYNGIDQNSIVKDISLNTYYAYLAIVLGIALLSIVLIKSVQADKKRTSNS